MKTMKNLGAALALVALSASGVLAQTAQPTNFRNLVIGGDFGTNPYQRGTANSATINTTGVYHADAWAAYANNAGAAIVLSRVTTGMPLGFAAAEQMQRTAANANTQQACMVHIFDTAESISMQGQTILVSFYGLAGSNYSAAGNAFQTVVTTGTGTIQSLASLIAATWTGQANVAAVPAVTLTTGFARYTVPVAVPAAATEVAVQLCMTPVGTAGANDFVQLTGIQVEIAQPGGAPGLTPVASPFEKRTATTELFLAQSRFVSFLELRGGTVATGYANATTNADMFLPFPRTMRVLVGNATCTYTVGGWSIQGGAGTFAITGFTGNSLSLSATPNGVHFQATTAAVLTVGQAEMIVGNAAPTGSILCSNDF